MIIVDFDALTEDSSFLAELEHNVWLMDDHRWALKVWETERKHDHYTLIHADYHWDGCYEFHGQPFEEEELVRATPDQIASLVAQGKWIRFDSFIAPAVKRGLIDTIHFYCLDDSGDDALDEEFMRLCSAQQFRHKSASQLAKANIVKPIIFDLCLDLFNRSNVWAQGDLWSDSEIDYFLKEVEPLISAAEIVTVSMSFNYSGTPEHTRHLTKRVMPQILDYRRMHVANHK